MSTSAIITVFANAAAVLIIVLLFSGAIAGGNLREKINRRFLDMLLFNLAAGLCEAIMPFVINSPGGEMSLPHRVLSLADFIFASLMFASFAMYFYEFLSRKVSVGKRPFVVMVCIHVLNIPITVVIVVATWFETLDRYVIEYLYEIENANAVIMLVPILIVAWITLRHIRWLRVREWISFLLYATIPLLAGVVELINHEIWLTFLGGAVSMFFMYVNIQIEMALTIKEQELELTRSRTAIMLSQIQPHFIINTLLNIESLCQEEGASRAEQVARDFSDYMRGNLKALTEKEPIPFTKELEHTKQYLSIAQVRFEDKLLVEYDIRATDFMLPALTVQPLVENAVWHGICNRLDGGTVTVRAEKAPEGHRVIIADNGVGFDPEVTPKDGRPHIGIENVRYRMETICGGGLAIDSTPGVGTNAILTIPGKDNDSNEHHSR